MKNFMKVTVVSRKILKYQVKSGEYASQEDTSRFIIPDTRRDVIVNLDEIAMAEKASLQTLDTDVAKVGEKNAICLKDKPGCNSFYPDELAELKYECLYGVVVLKNGIKTNLGLNGMNVDQTLYLVEESYDKLEKALLG